MVLRLQGQPRAAGFHIAAVQSVGDGWAELAIIPRPLPSNSFSGWTCPIHTNTDKAGAQASGHSGGWGKLVAMEVPFVLFLESIPLLCFEMLATRRVVPAHCP